MAVDIAGRHTHGGAERGRDAIRLRDRSLEFRRARRHSQLVRVLKVLLPLASIGVISLYLLPAFLTVRIDDGAGQASVESISLEAGALKMVNPRVTGVHDKQGEYDLRADSATQEASNPELLYLDKIEGRMTSPEGAVTTITAPGGRYDSKAEVMTFDRGIEILRSPGLRAKFQSATMHIREQRVVSETPVEVQLHDSSIRADRLTLFTAEGRAVFEGRVKAHLERVAQGRGSSPSGERAPAANGTIELPNESEQERPAGPDAPQTRE